jgi:hypothetical protein
VTREDQHFHCLDGVIQNDIAVAVGILEQADCSGEQMRGRFTFRGKTRLVRQRTRVFVKCFTHQCNAKIRIRQLRSCPYRDLDFLESLKDGSVIVAAQERPNDRGQARMELVAAGGRIWVVVNSILTPICAEPTESVANLQGSTSAERL